MSTPTTERTSSTGLSGGTLLGLVALGVVLVLGLVWLGGRDGRTEVLAWLSGLPGLLAAALAAIGLRQNRRTHEQVTNTAGVVEQVQHQTNGALTRRIDDAIARALAAAGVGNELVQDIPTQHPATHDTPAETTQEG